MNARAAAVPSRSGKATDDRLAKLAMDIEQAEEEIKQEYNARVVRTGTLTRAGTRTGTLTKSDLSLVAEFDVPNASKEKIDVAADFELNLDILLPSANPARQAAQPAAKDVVIEAQFNELDQLMQEIDLNFDLDF
jgi:hypothetical protein